MSAPSSACGRCSACLGADQAFAYLRRVSQNQHRKLVDVAVELVTTRRLPDVLHRADPSAGVDPAPGSAA